MWLAPCHPPDTGSPDRRKQIDRQHAADGSVYVRCTPSQHHGTARWRRRQPEDSSRFHRRHNSPTCHTFRLSRLASHQSNISGFFLLSFTARYTPNRPELTFLGPMPTLPSNAPSNPARTTSSRLSSFPRRSLTVCRPHPSAILSANAAVYCSEASGPFFISSSPAGVKPEV